MSNLTPGQDPLSLQNAPGGDTALDDLFPNPENFGGSDTGQPPAQPPVSNEPFVYTYKTREEAERGIREKDAYIERLKQEQADLQKRISPTAAPAPTPDPVNYAVDRKRYFRDIVDAVRKATETGDEESYAQVQQQFLFDQLGPAVPLFLENARTNAVNKIEERMPGAKTFISSEDYAKIKTELPELAEAIQNAENDFRYVGMLPGLYRTAYLSAQGLKVPELLRGTTSSTPGASAATPQPRPTLTNSTPAPPQPAPAVDLTTAEGRKAYIESAKARGVDNFPIR